MKCSPLVAVLAAFGCVGCVNQPTPTHQIPRPAMVVRDLVYDQIEAGRSLELDAYALYFGELLLYDSKEAAEHSLIYPYCLTANSHELDSEQRLTFDRKWVRVTGTLVEKDKHNDPPNTIRTMGTADGLPFANQCWGPFMLRIETIEVIEPESSDGN